MHILYFLRLGKKVTLLFEIEPNKVIEFKQVNADNLD
jgi:hypothetical protein